jgi:hypothetical protein
LKIAPVVKPEAIEELARLKAEKERINQEMTQEIKMKHLEVKNELKMKETIVKEKFKEELKQEIKDMKHQDLADSNSVTYKQIEDACSMNDFMENIWSHYKVEDYDDIFNGINTFEELFLQYFVEEYDKNKSVVLEKDGKGGYRKNDHCVWNFVLGDELGCGYKSLKNMIPLIHKTFKNYVKEEGRNVKDFILEEDVKKRLEINIKEAITLRIIYNF